MRTKFSTAADPARLPLLGAMVTVLIAAAACAPRIEAPSHPQFSGVWFSVENTHHVNESSDKLFDRSTGGSPWPNGDPHFKPQYARAVKAAIQETEEAGARGVVLNDRDNQCLPIGMPTIMRAIMPLEIIQTPKRLTVITEEYSQVRRIHLDETMPPEDEISLSYNGYSVGHWEGDTLVVETAGIKSDVTFIYMPNSGKMKLRERMRLRTPDLLEIEITIDDPDVLEKPYSFTWTYTRNDSHKILEYVCDNNRYVAGEGGARTLDVNIDR